MECYPMPAKAKTGRPTKSEHGPLVQVACKVTPEIYAHLSRIGDGVAGRGLRILAEKSAKTAKKSDAKNAAN